MLCGCTAFGMMAIGACDGGVTGLLFLAADWKGPGELGGTEGDSP